jgi:hypothetical protein
MNLEEILSVAGKPGLYKMVAQSRNGLIAESLADGKRIPVNASQQVSSLKDIAIYTYSEEVGLAEIFEKIRVFAGDAELPTNKASKDELLDFFSHILPDFDKERVYASHIKKVLSWYTVLDAQGILDQEEEVSQAVQDAEVIEEVAEEAPAVEASSEEAADDSSEEEKDEEKEA